VTRCDWQPPNPRRDFLVSLLCSCRSSGQAVKRFELSPPDEILLFEFICPTTKTRGRGFSLCNLPVRWGVKYSALVMADGQRRRFDLQYMIDFELVSPEQIRAAMIKLPGCRRESYDTWQSIFRRVLRENAEPKPKVRSVPATEVKRL